MTGSPKDTYKIYKVNKEEVEGEIHMFSEKPDKKVDIDMDREVLGDPYKYKLCDG